MRLAGKKAFVTGATGFIGGRLAERLTNEEHAEVRTLVRSPEQAGHLASIGIELVQGDVTDPASVRRAMEGCSLAFHCAALMHDADATLEGFRQVNVGGTANVLDAATDAGVELLVYISSIAVYGIDPRVHTDETGTFQTTGIPYSDSKTEAEELVARHAERTNLPLVIIRPANVYGPRSSFWTVGLLAMIDAGRLTLIDDGRGQSNHVYIDNLVDAILSAARTDSAVNEDFIISDGAETPWSEFLGYYARMIGRDPLPSISLARAKCMAFLSEFGVRIIGGTPGLTRIEVRCWTQTGTFDISKARRVLDYAPRVSLNEGMIRTEHWLRESGHIARGDAARYGKS